MSRPARKSAFLVLFIVVLAGLAWWLARPAQAPSPDPPLAHDPAAALPGPEPTAAPSRYEPTTLPLAFEGLRLRAEAGDGRAACQLGAKLIYCASLQRQLDEKTQAWFAQAEEELARKGQLEQANQWAQVRIKAIVAARECAGLPDQAGRMGHAWMRQAALSGEPDAMLVHASGGTLVTSIEDGWSFLQDERFRQWRTESPAMLQTLLEQGEPAALIALLKGYDNQSYLGWITTPDPDRALTLSLLADRVFKQSGGLPRAGYSVDLREREARERYRAAMLRARDWHQQYFDGQEFDVEPYRQRLKAPTGMSDQELDPPRTCGADWGGS